MGGSRGWGGEYWATIPPRRFKKLMKDPELASRFAKEMFHRRLTLEERLDLTRRCLERVHLLRRPEAPLFILSAASEHGEQAQRTYEIRTAYNAMCRDFCDATGNTHFIDIDRLLSPEEFVDSDHYTRTGYFKVAEFVNSFARPAAQGDDGLIDLMPAPAGLAPPHEQAA